METEANRAGEFIISEGPTEISRKTATIGAGNLPAGQVLGKVSASGNYVAYDPDATDGSEVAEAILYAPVDASGSPQPGTIVRAITAADRDLLTGSDSAAEDQLSDNFIFVQ